jgi:hypothetical protein
MPRALIELWSLKNLAFLSGLLHFCQVPAVYFAPKMLDWGPELAKLSPINRRIYIVIAIAITLTVLGLGVVVMAAPSEIAGASRLGSALACFLALFWAYRLGIQVFVYFRIWPGGWMGVLSNYGLTALLAFLTASYAVLFIAGGVLGGYRG